MKKLRFGDCGLRNLPIDTQLLLDQRMQFNFVYSSNGNSNHLSVPYSVVIGSRVEVKLIALIVFCLSKGGLCLKKRSVVDN